MMKWILFGILFVVVFFNVFVDVFGGVGCGWGNMFFKGQCGVVIYVVVVIINGIFGNNIFGMIIGINGCYINGVLFYGGKFLLVFGSMMDELFEDMVKGNGEVLIIYVVVLGV